MEETIETNPEILKTSKIKIAIVSVIFVSANLAYMYRRNIVDWTFDSYKNRRKNKTIIETTATEEK